MVFNVIETSLTIINILQSNNIRSTFVHTRRFSPNEQTSSVPGSHTCNIFNNRTLWMSADDLVLLMRTTTPIRLWLHRYSQLVDQWSSHTRTLSLHEAVKRPPCSKAKGSREVLMMSLGYYSENPYFSLTCGMNKVSIRHEKRLHLYHVCVLSDSISLYTRHNKSLFCWAEYKYIPHKIRILEEEVVLCVVRHITA